MQGPGTELLCFLMPPLALTPAVALAQAALSDFSQLSGHTAFLKIKTYLSHAGQLKM